MIRWIARTLGACVIVALLAASVVMASSPGRFKHPTRGYSFVYPNRWICDTKCVTENGCDGPVLTTFPKQKWVHGGIVPKGGAVIFVQAGPSENFPADTDEAVRLNEMASRECGCLEIPGGRRPDGSVRFDFHETWEAGTFKEVWAAQRYNGKPVVLMLSYYADDPKGPSYERDLESILSSVSLSR